jgi:ABC-type multidrug transport system fused ATPase/permease subunit
MTFVQGAWSQTFFFELAGNNLTKRLRKKAFQGILRQNIAWFDETEHNTGILTSRLASDATLIQGMMGDRLGVIVQNTITILLGILPSQNSLTFFDFQSQQDSELILACRIGNCFLLWLGINISIIGYESSYCIS